MNMSITPCLWFAKDAEEAMNLYVDIFNSSPYSSKNSKILSIKRYAADMKVPGASELAGKVLTAMFELNGQKFTCLDGGPIFEFNESVSFLVECKDQVEVDHFWDRFIADGGKESQCGWLKDKFGVSWQIIPKQLGKLAGDPDPVKSKRVVDRMLQMKKIIIIDLEKAYAGK